MIKPCQRCLKKIRAKKDNKKYCDECRRKVNNENKKKSIRIIYKGVYAPTADGRVFK